MSGYVRALRHIVTIEFPTVRTHEFSDMDRGDVAFEDDLVRVLPLASPAFDWAPPQPLDEGATQTAHAAASPDAGPESSCGRAGPSTVSRPAAAEGLTQRLPRGQEPRSLGPRTGVRVFTPAPRAAGDGSQSDASDDALCSSSSDDEEAACARDNSPQRVGTSDRTSSASSEDSSSEDSSDSGSGSGHSEQQARAAAPRRTMARPQVRWPYSFEF